MFAGIINGIGVIIGGLIGALMGGRLSQEVKDKLISMDLNLKQ